jgi:hypothetical protein
MNANIMLLAAAAIALAGCGATTPERLDAQMGDSVDLIKAQQTLNPQASANAKPVEGLDGPAADALVDHYRKTFAAPQPTGTMSVMSVTGGGSGR